MSASVHNGAVPEHKNSLSHGTQEPVIVLHVRVPKSLDRELERVAFESDSTKQQIVNDALRKYLRLDTAA